MERSDDSVRVAVNIRLLIPSELLNECTYCVTVTPGEPQISQLKMEKNGLMANIKIHNDLECRLVTLTKEMDILVCTNEKLSLKINEAEDMRMNFDRLISQLKMEKDNLMANIAALEAKMHDVFGLSNDGEGYESVGAESETVGKGSETVGAGFETDVVGCDDFYDYIKNLGYNLPHPVCTCTGTAQECYKYAGGWQSSCCTSSMLKHPLPMRKTSRHITKDRIAGRTMRKYVFENLLKKLDGEGYEFAEAIDLKKFWGK
ncbi:uncharacterized protein LOC144567919 [Carex rostrata]